ncbi:MAG: hypothetical protein GW938_02620 [Leptospira sp.]|nr:hypothetical protein [Leptospira sp.]NCS93224.1 hypothetical protein [Leptospira sp.]
MSKHCAYCGLSLDHFVTFGKFGCEYCIDFLKHHPLIYAKAFSRIPNDELEISKTYLSAARSEFQTLKLGKEPIHQISIRYRIARNLHKQIFPFFRKDTSLEEKYFKNNFPELGEFKNISKHIRKATLFENQGSIGNIILGDEDGIRLEVMQSFQNELSSELPNIFLLKKPLNMLRIYRFFMDPTRFSHRIDWGYLNSCPTNAARADRLSIQISQVALNRDLGDLNKDLSWDQNFEGNGISFASRGLEYGKMDYFFSVKNFTQKRKNHFLSSVNSIVL